jgi:hypothetical protein
VLWIRIRNNPNVLAGSESEKKFGFGFGFRHCCRMNIFWKIKNQTLEREKSSVFLLTIFFALTYRFQNTYESN